MTAPHSPRLHSLWPSHVLIDQLDELEDVRESLAQQAELFYERHTQNGAKLSHRADTVSMMREQPSHELLRLLACIEDRVANYVKRAYHFSTRSQCPRCPVVQLCKGACLFLEGEYWASACDNAFSHNLAVMAAALYYQTQGLILTRIESDAIRFDSVSGIPRAISDRTLKMKPDLS